MFPAVCDAHTPYHVFEGVLDGADHQALVGNLLLDEEARGRGAGRAGGAGGAAERRGPGEGALGRRGQVVVDRLLAETRGRRQVRTADDLHHLLKVQGDVVMQQAGRHDGRPGAGVAVEHGPVVEGEALGAVLDSDGRQTR